MSDPVLVVDDDAQVRELIRWALEDQGYRVATAADGREALERIGQALPRVVVLDATLPGIDGFGVADALRPRQVPIVMITADGSAAQKAKRMGAFAYLRKPFEMRLLLEAVRRGCAA